MKSEPTAILIPSLWRPEGLSRVLHNLEKTTPETHQVYACVDRNDGESMQVCLDFGVNFITDDGDYFVPRLQKLYEWSTEPWFFTGSDDIIFSNGWLTGCFAAAQDHHRVICPNDGHNPNGTNFLVSREYITEHSGTIDGTNEVYHPGYFHNFSDDELVGTARKRGVYTRAMGVLVESTHPGFGNAPDDDTYRKPRAMWGHDEALYHSRRHLWED